MEDLELVRKCIQADKKAWEEFLLRYSRLIYNYIYTVLKLKGALNLHSEADDLFNEVYISLCRDDYKKLRSFKAINGCSFSSWLRIITVNSTIDFIRKLKPSLSIEESIDEQGCIKELIIDNCISVPDNLNQKEVLSYLKDCIKRLDIDEKHFLQMHIDAGLTLEQLKGYFGLSRGAVDMRKSRIVDKLRNCFQHKGVTAL